MRTAPRAAATRATAAPTSPPPSRSRTPVSAFAWTSSAPRPPAARRSAPRAWRRARARAGARARARGSSPRWRCRRGGLRPTPTPRPGARRRTREPAVDPAALQRHARRAEAVAAPGDAGVERAAAPRALGADARRSVELDREAGHGAQRRRRGLDLEVHACARIVRERGLRGRALLVDGGDAVPHAVHPAGPGVDARDELAGDPERLRRRVGVDRRRATHRDRHVARRRRRAWPRPSRRRRADRPRGPPPRRRGSDRLPSPACRKRRWIRRRRRPAGSSSWTLDRSPAASSSAETGTRSGGPSGKSAATAAGVARGIASGALDAVAPQPGGGTHVDAAEAPGEGRRHRLPRARPRTLKGVRGLAHRPPPPAHVDVDVGGMGRRARRRPRGSPPGAR